MIRVKRDSNPIFTIDGISRSAREWQRHMRLSMQTVSKRLSRRWTLQEAVTSPKEDGIDKYLYNGQLFNLSELYSLRKDELMTKKCILDRLKAGVPAKHAIETPTMTVKECIFANTKATVEGVTKTFLEWSLMADIDIKTIRRRVILDGWTTERGIWFGYRGKVDVVAGVVVPLPFGDTLVTVDGITKAIYEWAAMIGVDVDAIERRVKKNKWSLEKAVSRGHKGGRLYTVGDETHTLSKWGEITGMGYALLYKKVRRGMSIEEVMIAREEKTLSVDGTERTINEWSEITGIPSRAIEWRINRGLLPKEAVTKPYNAKKQKVTAIYNGIEQTLTIPEWAVLHGVPPGNIYGRVHIGMSREEAVSKPFASPKKIITAHWEGKEHTMSVKEWSALTGVMVRTIQSRVYNLEWTYEKAVSTPVRSRNIR